MSIFVNPFFSGKGQVERLKNVKDTLVAAVTGKGVQANTPSKAVNTVLSAAASNPFTTAAVVTPVNTAKAAVAGFNALPAAGKVASAIAAPVVIGAVVSNPSSIGKAAQAPAALSNFGSNVGGFINNPSTEAAKGIFKENPVISSIVGIGTAAVIGAAATGAITSAANTVAVKANTKAVNNMPSLPAATNSPVSMNAGSTTGISTTGPQSPMVVSQSRAVSTKRTSRKPPVPNRITTNVRLNIINANQSRITSKRYISGY